MTSLSRSRSALLNAVANQVGWFACVLGAAAGWGAAGAAVALALVLLHLVFASRPEVEWPLVLVAGGLGLVIDTLHADFGVLEFKGHEAGAVAPLWIFALWVQFATTLRFCMSWLSRRYVLASMFGLIGGPLAFLGGERLGAATFGEPRFWSLAVVAASWSVALPLLVAVSDRMGEGGRYRLSFSTRSAEPHHL